MRIRIPVRYKGQGTLEYLLLFTAVVTVVFFFLMPKHSSYQDKLNATYGAAANGAFGATQQLFCSLANSVP